MNRFLPSLLRLESRLNPVFSINSTGPEGDGKLEDGIADTGIFDDFNVYKGLSGIVTLAAARDQASVNFFEGKGADTISFGVTGPFPSSDLIAPPGWSVTGGVGGIQMSNVSVSGGGSIHDITFSGKANVFATGAGSQLISVFGALDASLSNGAVGINVNATGAGLSGDDVSLTGSTIVGGISATGKNVQIISNTSSSISASGTKLLISTNTITGAPFAGIDLSGTEATVVNNLVTGSGRSGITLSNMRNSTLEGNTVRGSADNGINLSTTSNVQVLNNVISDGKGTFSSGIQVQGEFSDPAEPPVVIQGNTITNNTFGGVRAIIVPSLTVIGNSVTGNKFGINIDGRNNVSSVITMTVNDNVGQRISITVYGKNDAVVIQRNQVERINVSLYPTDPSSANGRVTVEDNKVSQPDGEGGITIAAHNAAAIVRNNTAQSQISVDIEREPPFFDFDKRIEARGNLAQSMYFSANGSSFVRNVVADNTVDGAGNAPGETGLSINGAFFDITGNTVRDTTGSGVYLATDDSTFSKNTVVRSGFDGVTVNGERIVIGTPYGSDDASLGNTISHSGTVDPLQGNGILTFSAAGVTMRHNRIFSNKRLGIDNGGNFVDRFRRDDGSLTPAWRPTITRVVPGSNQIHWMLNATADTKYQIDIYSNPAGDFITHSQGESHGFAVFVTTDSKGHVEFQTGVPTLEHITATSTAPTGATSEFSLADLDADGLADVWEMKGIDLAGDGTFEVMLANANLRHKDVYVEIDAMAGYDPDFTSMQSVVQAFARVPNTLVQNPDGAPGITLHYDAKHQNTGLPAFDFGPESGVWDKYQGVKRAHFGNGDPASAEYKARSLAFRYCLFAQTYGDKATQPKSYFSSGLAEARGNDFMVTLGSTGTQDFVIGQGQKAQRRGWFDHLSPEAYRLQQAGTFMHELGHTLGLDHVGPTNWYFQPLFANQGNNYFSVMNYTYQSVAQIGLPARRQILDYSRANPQDWQFLQYGFQESTGSQNGADAITTVDPAEESALPAVTPGLPDIYSFGTGPADPVGLGVSIPLAFTVSNAGDAPASGATLRVTLPAGLTLVSATGSTGTVAINGSVITLSAGTLGTAAESTLTLSVTAAANGSFTVGALAGSATADGLVGNEISNVTITADANSPPPPPATIVNQFAVGRDRGASASVELRNADNTLRYSVTPFGATFTGGVRTASGDINGDGVADLIAASGVGRVGEVRVFDGVTQAEIPLPQANLPGNRPFGNSFTRGIIVAAGDLNNDSLDDLIITAEAGGGARVRIFQSTGSGFIQRSDFIALIGGDNVPDSKIFRGGSRATVSDINGDGVGDLIWAAGAGGGPRIATFDGTKINNGSNVTFKLTGDFFALSTTLRDGCYLAGGDLNGDGIGDLIAGGGSGAPPQVVGFSGKTLMQNNFSKFLDFTYGNPATRQGIRVAVKDLNADGRDDLLLGSAPTAGSHVVAFDGKNLSGSNTGLPIFEFDAFPGFTGGVFVG